MDDRVEQLKKTGWGMTNADLKALCKEKGLAVSGRKAVLIARLEAVRAELEKAKIQKQQLEESREASLEKAKLEKLEPEKSTQAQRARRPLPFRAEPQELNRPPVPKGVAYLTEEDRPKFLQTRTTSTSVALELNRPPVPKGVAYFTDEDRETVMERIRDEGDPIGIYGVSAGWRSLDEYYRVVPGELTIATGVPGSGKSEWLLSLATNIAKERGWRFLLFAFEADDRYLAIQLMEKKTRTEYKHISEDDIDDHLAWIDDHFSLGHSAFASVTIDDILDLATREARSLQGLQGLIIDPYNYIDRPTVTGQFETEFVSQMLSKIKRFAHEHKVHVWVIAHPTKSSSWNKMASKPSMYNIAGSANWFNKADMGVIIHRKMLAVGDDVIPDRKIEIHIEKVRSKDAGQIGIVELLFAKEQRGYLEVDDSF